MALRSFALCSLVLFSCRPAGAQADSAAGISGGQTAVGTVVGDAGSVVWLAGRVFSAPARWDMKDAAAGCGVLIVAGGSSLLDTRILSAADRNRKAAYDRLDDVFTQYGDGLTIALASGACYGAGLLLDEHWLRETALLAGTATLFSGAVSTIVKVTVGRARPYTGLNNHTFRHFTSSEDYLSFPSGHSVVAFSVSTVLSERIGNPWATAALYTAATLTAASRIYSRDHWFSDTVFGGIVASAIAHTVVQEYEARGARHGDSRLEIVPGPGSLTVLWRW